MLKIGIPVRNFVLVTAIKSEPGKKDIQGSGIRKLKRGVTIQQFIYDYLSHVDLVQFGLRETVDPKQTHIFDRNGSYTAVFSTDNKMLMWIFTQYTEENVLEAVAHLSLHELKRDISELKPIPKSVKDKLCESLE
jgi:hypothetical protein